MSFMSVPALDRLLEPSEIESTSLQPWSAKANRKTIMNMLPLFPSQPRAHPSPPQSYPSPPTFSPSPYILNFKRRVFDGNGTSDSDNIVEASCYDLDVDMQRNNGHICEATSSFRAESEVASDLKNKMINNKNGQNEDGMLLVREVQERLSLRGKSWEGQERSPIKNIDKTREPMANPVIRTVEAIYNGRRKQEFGRGSRSRNPSIGQQDMDFSSISLSNQEEFFDAPEEPFEDIASDEESRQAQRTPKSILGSRSDVDGYLMLELDQEIKRRMAAEDAMAVLQLQCIEMASQLASLDEKSRGLNDSCRNDWDSDSHAQNLVVAQVVAYSVARGAARAEIDEEMENVVAEKNREIARLLDKLHYYELVNHEMSQRNREAFELARSRRHIRRNRNQWFMVCVGSAICMGVSAVLVSKFAPWATLYFPSKSVLQSHMQSHMQTDAYHSSPSHDI